MLLSALDLELYFSSFLVLEPLNPRVANARVVDWGRGLLGGTDFMQQCGLSEWVEWVPNDTTSVDNSTEPQIAKWHRNIDRDPDPYQRSSTARAIRSHL